MDAATIVLGQVRAGHTCGFVEGEVFGSVERQADATQGRATATVGAERRLGHLGKPAFSRLCCVSRQASRKRSRVADEMRNIHGRGQP